MDKNLAQQELRKVGLGGKKRGTLEIDLGRGFLKLTLSVCVCACVCSL